ncbi:hypothetical protein [Afifella pfennigii]|uniref:hypothetical protein n=1 Tax=Afifella pfennigii TaxID=209897 RepID=UPI00047A5822|nr:hypothetical protein [Afifella pfennigii]
MDERADESVLVPVFWRRGAVMLAILAALAVQPAAAQDSSGDAKDTADAAEGAEAEEAHAHDARHDNYIYGRPAQPSRAWMLSMGGRIYDNWWLALNVPAPQGTHPSWPASNTEKSGDTTWRCASCHGWDYLGVAGQRASDEYKTGIVGVRGAIGMSTDEVEAILRDDTHQYTQAMISSDATEWLRLFLSQGQHDANAYINAKTGEVAGDLMGGRDIFQNICAACHGYDGTALDWGDNGEHAYIGTEANANPWEVLHKIRNGHPGHEMVTLRAFPIEDSVNVLAFERTLPEE